MIRRPAVAGTFYPGSKERLEKEVAGYITPAKQKKRVLGLISPHAGYVYSGACAGKGFAAVNIPAKVIILGVNHRGFGHSFAVDGSDYWSTPLGDAALDDELRSRLVKESKVFEIDSAAGRSEHSLEVQLPFIQYLNPGARIVPITVSCVDLRDLLLAGEEIAALLKEDKDVFMVASTDMSHYIDAESANQQDHKAIDKILALDARGLYNTVMEERISMCGVAPTVIMLSAAVKAGAKKAEEVHYTNSGAVSGDYDQVVGYFSGIVY